VYIYLIKRLNISEL